MPATSRVLSDPANTPERDPSVNWPGYRYGLVMGFDRGEPTGPVCLLPAVRNNFRLYVYLFFLVELIYAAKHSEMER